MSLSIGRMPVDSRNRARLRGTTDPPDDTAWTDDLPICHHSGVGYAPNKIYREDGFHRENVSHAFEDTSFHFKGGDDMFLYGVFDGHDGPGASAFAAQRLPAELLLGQLDGKVTDEEVKHIIYQAFISVDKSYFDSIDEHLAERAKLLLHVPEGLSPQDAYEQYPQLFKQLDIAESKIKGGTTAVVALVYNNKLYVANIGHCRALLCTRDSEGVLRMSQLTMDHTLDNPNEIQRLSALGLDVERVCRMGHLGGHNCTRTIGDYHSKGGYRDQSFLSACSSEPVIAEPEICCEVLDETCQFLIIMSDGLYKTLENATGTERVNQDIASIVASQFSQQSTLHGVAQAVVDKVVRLHHDAFMTGDNQRKQLCQQHDDIVLLIRNFHTPLGGSRVMTPPSVIIPAPDVGGEGDVDHRPFFRIQNYRPNNVHTATLTNSHGTYTSSNDSTQSGEGSLRPFNTQRPRPTLELNEDGRVEPYVDFTELVSAIEEMSETDREAFDNYVEPRPDCETIMEEREPQSPDGTINLSALSENPSVSDQEPEVAVAANERGGPQGLETDYEGELV